MADPQATPDRAAICPMCHGEGRKLPNWRTCPVCDGDGTVEGDEMPDCPYCRGSGLSPYSIRDVPCRHCGGQG